MSENAKIEWTDHTFNPWWGCQKVGPGCDHCYAETLDKRTGGKHWGPGVERRRTSIKNWGDPVRWNAKADEFFAVHGRRQMVFCASMADVFDNAVPDTWRMDLFKLIADTPNLDWLILTKRIGNVMTMCSGDSLMFDLICERVWLGATVVNQEEADRDIPKLLAVPAAKRFLSMEPLLGFVDLPYIGRRSIQCGCGFGIRHNKPNFAITPIQRDTCITCGQQIDPGPTLDWVIVGGESGPNARPMHPDWARSLRDQCEAAGVPFLFKQWGNWRAAAWFDGPDADNDVGDTFIDLDRTNHQFIANDGRTWDTFGGQYMYPPMPLGHWCLMVNKGKKAAGRLLDGCEWNGYPESPFLYASCASSGVA